MPRGEKPNSRANLALGKQHQFTAETAAKWGRKGAEVSNRVQRERKTLRELLDMLLVEMAVGGENTKNPTTGEPLTNAQSVALSLVLKARSGDVAAIKQLAELIGETTSTPAGVNINVSLGQ